jgi:hypothetical protein
MLSVELDAIDEEFLKNVCAEKWPESLSLDFKRDIPGSSDKDKNEILKDVCGFANSGGGDLVYGIGELEGAAEKIFAVKTEGFDVAKRRIGQIIDSGIEPRVNNVRIHHVQVTEGYILIVRIPPQFDGPYRTNLNGVTRFYMRNGIYTAELSYQQLRQAFGSAAALYDKAAAFRAKRLEILAANKSHRPLPQGPRAVLHLIPLQGQAGGLTIDPIAVRSQISAFVDSGWGSVRFDYNLDGGFIYQREGTGPEVSEYIQVYRNGAFEGACHAIGTPGLIPSQSIAEFFRKNIQKWVSFLQKLQFGGPALVGGALFDVAGSKLAVGRSFNPAPRSDRNNLIFPDALIENIADFQSIDDIARPMADIMWQSFGEEKCSDYNAAGAWEPRR